MNNYYFTESKWYGPIKRGCVAEVINNTLLKDEFFEECKSLPSGDSLIPEFAGMVKESNKDFMWKYKQGTKPPVFIAVLPYEPEGELTQTAVPIAKEGVRIENLLDMLAQYGGTIESTGAMDEMNIKQAMASGRLYVDENSLGYVWMPGSFKSGPFPETVEEVELFEKWFPLPVELPKELENLDWLHKKKGKQDWSALGKIGPPEKWIEVYKHYQDLLTEIDAYRFRINNQPKSEEGKQTFSKSDMIGFAEYCADQTDFMRTEDGIWKSFDEQKACNTEYLLTEYLKTKQ